MADRRQILFLTGTRADFGKLKPLISAVRDDESLDYHVYATGMHLLERHGSTVNEIRAAGFDRLTARPNQSEGSGATMDLVLARTVEGLGEFIRDTTPDLLVVHGDRPEALAGAVTGILNGTLVAHVEGGEISGTVDELLRHAISKLSHVHFVANDESARRLVQMGEVPGSVHVIGSPETDVMLSDHLPELDDVRRRYEIGFERYGILIFHPVTTEEDDLARQCAEVLAALDATDMPFVVLYPNNDTGVETVLPMILGLEGDDRFRVLPSMRFEFFLTMLKHASMVLGNSSVGVREAPVYGVPSINVGTRQRRRASSPSIVDVPAERDAIIAAMASLPARHEPAYPFGSGDSARRFREALLDPSFWEAPRQKQFQDLGRS